MRHATQPHQRAICQESAHEECRQTTWIFTPPSQTCPNLAKSIRWARARILLTSVFGPYAQDDEYGSRVMNPMELYHNQVTRTQGPFSLRMFHRSWGIMLIQCNIEAPCTVLDFPELDRFVEELRNNQYDIVGITSIVPNIFKVKKMCELVRQYQPNATIVVGGHLANVPDLLDTVDADHAVKRRGRGVVPPLFGRESRSPHPPSRDCLGHRHPQHGRDGPRPARRRGGHAHPVGRLPAGMQLLLHLGHVRRQGQVGQLLPDRRRTVRHHASARRRDARLVVLRHGRKLPPGIASGPCACWN